MYPYLLSHSHIDVVIAYINSKVDEKEVENHDDSIKIDYFYTILRELIPFYDLVDE